MLSIIRKLISKNSSPSSNTPQFLTTKGVNYLLDTMFKNAAEYITIISPFIKIHPGLIEILEERHNSGIIITIICRESQGDFPFASKVYHRKNLHAKCYLTENSALISSMNLYDFSQIHNDEMGIHIQRDTAQSLYDDVLCEAKRLSKDFTDNIDYRSENTLQEAIPSIKQNSASGLQKGKKYTIHDLKSVIKFKDDYKSGIKQTIDGNIVLFCSSRGKYQNKEKDGILYFQGQNTGTNPQKLIYGNKILDDAYNNKSISIYLFRDDIFYGEQCICEKPFLENGTYYFPLREKQDSRNSDI
jgi:hypothetical protein